MTKFVVVYHTPVSARAQMANATPEQMKSGMELWMNWFQKIGGAVVDTGAPLGNAVKVTPGASSPLETTVTGYTVVQAASKEDAIKLLEGHPHFHLPESSIHVFEAMQIPGM
jgi:hypothetical protein